MSFPGYFASRQMGLLKKLPRNILDRALIAPLMCIADDDYQSIAPDLDNPHLNPEPPTYVINFCPVSGYHNLLALANEDGAVYIQDTDKVLPKLPFTGRRCHENAIFSLCWAEQDAGRLVTASGDQTVAIWDLQSDNAVRRLMGHSRSVKTVKWRPQSADELASAGRDNIIMLWDLRCHGDHTPENLIRNAHSLQNTHHLSHHRRKGTPSSHFEKGSACSVTCLSWLDSNTLVSVGDNDGKIKLWDIRKQYRLYRGDPHPKLELSHPGTSSNRGFTWVSTDPISSYVYVSCMDSNIYQYDVVNEFQQPTSVFTGADIKNFFIIHSISPCGRYLASGSADQWCYIWNTGMKIINI